MKHHNSVGSSSLNKRKESEASTDENIGISPTAPTEISIGSTIDVNLIGTTTLPSANKRYRSEVWEHFEKMYDVNGNEMGRAICKWCGKDYQGKSELGTSGLWKHLRESCKKYPNKKELVVAYKNKDKSQTTLNFVGSGSDHGKLISWKFDQEACREALVRMIIKDELPFMFVEHEGFKEFIAVICPEFKIPSRVTIARDCYSLFIKERKKLKDLIERECKRVSLTTDTWTSIQNVSYLCLTAHFIDSNWKMQKRILNFCVIKSHKGANIGNVIDYCLDEWCLNKVMCITVDNASSNDAAIQQLKNRLSKKDAFVLGGEAFHMRCCAHILQLIVKDGLQCVDNSIKKIRAVVKYVRSSPQRLEFFKKSCEVSNIKYTKSLILDCPTRWNSTYLMLETTLEYQKAFDKLEDVDTKFLVEFGTVFLTDVDWYKVRTLTKFLKRFYEVTCKLSGTLYSTANLYFPEIIRILTLLQSSEKCGDDYLDEMRKQMKLKFDKYWGSINKMNIVLFTAVVLDPRFKMKFIISKYTAFYGELEAELLVAKVRDALNRMINAYKEEETDVAPIVIPSPKLDDNEDDGYNTWFIENEDTEEVVTLGDLDVYLNDKLAKNSPGFDILDWWKVNAPNFPTLAKVAKDVLAVQCSTVASESAFSTGGRTLDQFRSSLTPITAEVLLCCQDWLRCDKEPMEKEASIEELEKFESDISQDPEVSENIVQRITVEC